MNKAPKIYADWVKVFELLKSCEDDENVLTLMQEGTIVWQSGVAERFLKRLVDTVNFRLNRATDNFQKAHQTDENEIIQSLMQLRREFGKLSSIIKNNKVTIQ